MSSDQYKPLGKKLLTKTNTKIEAHTLFPLSSSQLTSKDLLSF